MGTQHFMGYLESLPPKEASEALDIKAQMMRNSITLSKNYQPKTERVIYVSTSGDDSNDGLSIERPIATLKKVYEIQMPGDTVLFKRGDHFRGRIKADRENVTYSAYGDGIKPIIDSSRRNYADPSIWKATDCENVYVCTEEIVNAGLVHFDPSYTYGSYQDKYGKMQLRGGRNGEFMDYCDLNGDLQFFCDRKINRLYIYSKDGNPGERFLDIEIAESGHTFAIGAYGITIDNLWITHTGSHGVGAGFTKALTVQNCIFSWIGGSMLGGQMRKNSFNLVRYGNAVEVFGGCDGYTVKNNWMYQIYDTAITHQYNKFNECHQTNILYRDNLIEFCFWYIEFYNRVQDETLDSSTTNVYITGNFCRYGGYGWGCRGRENHSPMFSGTSAPKLVDNFVAENNIFAQTKGFLVALQDRENWRKIRLVNNVYVNEKGKNLGKIYNVIYPFDETAKKNLIELVGEDMPTVVYINNPEI